MTVEKATPQALSGPAVSLEDRLVGIGLERKTARLFSERRIYSSHKLEQLRGQLRSNKYLNAYPALCVYAAGSYARGEASEHSDLDLFFIHNDEGNQPTVEDPKLKGIRVVSAVIRVIEEKMDFPAPSNDGQFLNIANLKDVLDHLGGSEDDYRNHFTARMLLLLESAPIYGRDDHEKIIAHVLGSYMRDYAGHTKDFRPTFLVNDILRFWRTLCLNYEHRRNQRDQAKKVNQKIKNFKLGFSRLSTCFATVSLLASYTSVDLDGLREIARLTPLERLLLLADRQTEVVGSLRSALEQYAWFLEKTALDAEDLRSMFEDRGNRTDAFERARSFGQDMFDITHVTAVSHNTLRYLVI